MSSSCWTWTPRTRNAGDLPDRASSPLLRPLCCCIADNHTPAKRTFCKQIMEMAARSTPWILTVALTNVLGSVQNPLILLTLPSPLFPGRVEITLFPCATNLVFFPSAQHRTSLFRRPPGPGSVAYFPTRSGLQTISMIWSALLVAATVGRVGLQSL
jgi:hypothetical protein